MGKIMKKNKYIHKIILVQGTFDLKLKVPPRCQGTWRHPSCCPADPLKSQQLGGREGTHLPPAGGQSPSLCLQPGRWAVTTQFPSFCSPSNYHCTRPFFHREGHKNNSLFPPCHRAMWLPAQTAPVISKQPMNILLPLDLCNFFMARDPLTSLSSVDWTGPL